jgi:hypothetical protein
MVTTVDRVFDAGSGTFGIRLDFAQPAPSAPYRSAPHVALSPGERRVVARAGCGQRESMLQHCGKSRGIRRDSIRATPPTARRVAKRRWSRRARVPADPCPTRRSGSANSLGTILEQQSRGLCVPLNVSSGSRAAIIAILMVRPVCLNSGNAMCIPAVTLGAKSGPSLPTNSDG